MAKTSSTSTPWTELSKALRFAVVGGLATIVHLGVAMTALDTGVGAFQSNLIGFCVAFITGLLGHSYFTFGLSGGFGGSVQRYALIAIVGFSVNNGLLVVLKAVEAISTSAALAVAILAVPVGTFLAARFWGFVSHS